MTDKQTTPKRFIAGAVCPKCSEMDKIVMYKQDGVDIRECVACGFSDRQHIQPAYREPETRVSTSHEEKKAQTQVLQFQPLTDKNSDNSQ